MNKIIYGTMVIFLGMALWCEAWAEPIAVQIFSDAAYPPYSYEEKETVQGIYPEVLKVIFSRIEEYRVTIIPVPWKRGLKAIEDGEVLALFPPYHNVDKRPWMWPYSLPILEERTVVFCHSGIFAKGARPHWPEDYYGLTIGNNAGFAFGGDKFWQAVKAEKLRVEEGRGNAQNLLKLAIKRIDCYMNDRLSILWELNRLKATGEYNEAKQEKLVEGATISVEYGFLGFTDRDNSKFPYKKEFLMKFDSVLYQMKKSGEVQQIVEQYLKRKS